MAPSSKFSVKNESLASKLKNVDFPRNEQGNLVIPATFKTHKEAILWLDRKSKEAEQTVKIQHAFNAFPLDAAVAFSRGLEELFGFTSADTIETFFGDIPPTFLNVPVSTTEFIRVPVGQMSIPNVEGKVHGIITLKHVPHFTLVAEVKRKCEPLIQAIIKETERQLEQNSIYKGRAISLDLSWVHNGADFMGNAKYDPQLHAPSFLDLPEDPQVILNPDAEAALSLELWAHISQRDWCRKMKLDPKRGVLLFGPYGTGKTHIATVTAAMATKLGTTFILLRNVTDLAMCLKIAQQYAPVVVFAEDIDRVVGTDRDQKVDDILNTIDGVELKGKEIITVLTTNHIDDINAAMKRPGRTVPIHIDLPDASSVEKLILLYGKGDIEPNSNFPKSSELMASKFPPVQIKAVIEASRVAARLRTGMDDIRGQVTDADIHRAALVAVSRLDHCKIPEADKRPAAVQFAEALVDHAVAAIKNSSEFKIGPFAPRDEEIENYDSKPALRGVLNG